MKVLVVYDTQTPNRCTEKVAKAITGALREGSIEATAASVKAVDLNAIKDYDCIVVGSPTMYRRATKGIAAFLEKLGELDLGGKLTAAFDTQSTEGMGGSATSEIEKKMAELGFRIIVPSLIVKVKKTGEYSYVLEEKELEGAKPFASNISKMLSILLDV
jgi:flavorubredoxin